MVPDGWSRITIGQVAKVTSGGTPSRTVQEYWNGSIPWVTTGLVDFNVIREAAEHITPEGLANSSAKLFPPRTLLVALYGDGVTRGKVAMLGIEAATNQACAAILPCETALSEFMFYYIAAHYEALRRGSADGNQKNLSGNLIKSFPLLLPPLPEQRKISDILSTWDRAIELTEKLIAAKQKRKQAIMQQLLTGKVRLPLFRSGKKNRISEIVRVPAAVRRGLYPPSVQPGIPKITYRPDGWAETTMEKLLQIEQRPIELVDDTEYQLVVAKRNRGGIEPRERLLGRDIKTPSQFEVRAGDFVISKRQIIHGACGVVPESLDRAIVSNEYSVGTVNRSLNMEFLKYLSHTLYFQQTCFHASVGVALEKMIFRLEQWLKFPFLIPPIEEQKAIVSVLAAMDKELDLLAARSTLLSQQKKGLMQQLLTGKVRLEESPTKS